MMKLYFILPRSYFKPIFLLFTYPCPLPMSLDEAIIQMVQSIPAWSVTSYESIASILSEAAGQQIPTEMVSDLLISIPEDERSHTPWWRVVAHDGRLTSMNEGMIWLAQIRLLEDEGINVSEEWYVDILVYGWQR